MTGEAAAAELLISNEENAIYGIGGGRVVGDVNIREVAASMDSKGNSEAPGFLVETRAIPALHFHADGIADQVEDVDQVVLGDVVCVVFEQRIGRGTGVSVVAYEVWGGRAGQMNRLCAIPANMYVSSEWMGTEVGLSSHLQFDLRDEQVTVVYEATADGGRDEVARCEFVIASGGRATDGVKKLWEQFEAGGMWEVIGSSYCRPNREMPGE